MILSIQRYIYALLVVGYIYFSYVQLMYAQETQEPTEIVTYEGEARPITIISPGTLDLPSTQFSLALPKIGTITLYSGQDPVTGRYTLRATAAEQNRLKTINLAPAPIVISNAELAINDQGQVTFNAQATLFGKTAQVSLVDIKKAAPVSITQVNPERKEAYLAVDSIQFRITFREPVAIPIVPGKSVAITTADLVIAKPKRQEQAITLTAPVAVFNQAITLTFTFNRDAAILNFYLRNISLGQLIPGLSSAFSGITINDALFKTEIPREAGQTMPKKPVTTTMSGKINMSSLAPTNVTIPQSNNLQFIGSMAAGAGVDLAASVQDLVIPQLGTIHNAQLVFKSSLTYGSNAAAIPASLLLKGTGKVAIPEVGMLAFILAAAYENKAFSLEASIPEPVTYKDVSLLKAKLEVHTATDTLTIAGNMKIQSIDFTGILQVVPDKVQKNQKIVLFNATLQTSIIKPFETTSLPDFLRTVTITDAKASVDVAAQTSTSVTGSITMSGNTTIINVPVFSLVKFITEAKQVGIILKAETPSNWVAYIQDPAGKQALQSLNNLINKQMFVASSISYRDVVLGTVTRGLSLSAQFPLPYEVEQLIGTKGQIVTVRAQLDPADLAHTSLSAELSQGLASTKQVSSGPLLLEVVGTIPPTIGLKGKLLVRPSNKDPMPLEFTGTIRVNPAEAIFGAGMKGFWDSPLGFTGFSVGDVFLDLGLSYTPPTVARLGIAGTMKLETIIVAVATLFDRMTGDIALHGTLNELILKDLVRIFATRMGASGIPLVKIPDISVRGIDIKFAPKRATIGEVVIEPGLTARGTLTIANKQALVDFSIDAQGVKALGCMSSIDLGVLHITKSTEEKVGARPDVCASALLQAGPLVQVELTPKNQDILLSSRILLEAIFDTNNYVQVSNKGIEFHMKTAIAGNMFTAQVDALAAGKIAAVTTQDMYLKIDLQQDFISYINGQISKGLEQARKDIEQEIAQAQAAVDQFHKSDKILKEIEAAQSKIDELNKAIAQENESWNKLSTNDQIFKSAPHYATLSSLEGQVAAQKAYIETLKLSLKVIDAVTYDAAKGALDAAQKAGVAVIRGTQVVTQNILNAAVVKRAAFEGSLQKVKKGVLPDMAFDMIILGNPVTYRFSFDFTQIGKSTTAIVNSVVSSVKQALKIKK